MTNQSKMNNILGVLVVITLVFSVGVWFRTYKLQESKAFLRRDARSIVENVVKERIIKSLEQKMRQEQPSLEGVALKSAAATQLKEILEVDRSQYDKAVSEMLATMPQHKTIKYMQHYLTGADSYHFFYLTRRIKEDGNIASQFYRGKYFDPKRQTPDGLWTPLQLHPYVGYFVYLVFYFVAGLPLMEACAYFPLFMLIFVVIGLYWLCDTLHYNFISFLGAGFALVLSPVFLQRSSFGWYDNDIYNVFFPLIIMTLVIKVYREASKKWLFYAVLAAFLTGLYSYFWVGWPFVFLLCLGATFFLSFIQLFMKEKIIHHGFPLIFVYLAVVSLFALVLSSPEVMFEYFSRGAEFVAKFGSTKHDAWPNIFLTVGEAHAAEWKKIMYLVSNPVTFMVSIAGVLLAGIVRFCDKSKQYFLDWIFFLIILLPLLFLARRTERFTLLLVLPFSILVGMGLDSVGRIVSKMLGRLPFERMKKICASLVTVLVLVALLPTQLMYAHALGLLSEPIMNDAWYRTLVKLKNKTPQNAIVVSWWSPGYFILSFADRRVFADGGTQHLPESYWLARFFMARSETEALNILRMLNGSGNRSVEYLQETGVPLYKAIELINEALLLGPEDQRIFLKRKLSQEHVDKLMSYLHGPTEMDPTYVYVYNEMAEKSLAISLFARWDFKKASDSAGSRVKAKNDYIQQVIDMSGGVLNYDKPAKVIQTSGDILIFQNGVRFNLETMESQIVRENEKIQGNPIVTTYYDGINVRERLAKDNLLGINVFVYKKGTDYFSLFADRRLIESMLFRLYHMNGFGLKHFTLIDQDADPSADTYIKVFEIKWNESMNGGNSL